MTPVALLTVEDARHTAEQHPDSRYELHHGELVKMSNPTLRHQSLQRKIAKLLEVNTADYGLVYVEFGFRALKEYEARRADVALISHTRLANAQLADEFFGAPDLVIEVLSPSNRVADMDEIESLYLSNGCLSFWVVNPLRNTVRVTQPGKMEIYEITGSIPLYPFSPTGISVNAIFL